jgi:septum site-determining protein MinC
MGDVNPGAEIIAAGDIIVWGSIRGSVWAGSKGNRKAKIIARELNPSKLKIDEYVYMGIIGDLKGNSKTAFLIEEDIAIESY